MRDESRRSADSAALVSPAAVIAIACLGAAIVTSGIQGIAPAIPAIQAEFSMSAAAVSLITSVYLLPSIVSAFGSGMLADRIGIRPVFAASLALFGVGGVVLLVVHAFWVLMLVRFVQGAAFGAVLALSISIIGGVAPSGLEAARGQGRRIISMAVAEAVLPAMAGVLLALGWFAPFGVQVLAIPLAVAVWLALPPIPRGRRSGAGGTVRVVLRAPAVLGVQVLGALRFVFKFAVITYFPLLAVNEIGLSAVVVGLVLGAAALLTAAAAALTEKLADRWSSAQLIGGCLLVIAVCTASMAANQPAVAVAALLLFGLQDGVYGVAHNVLITEMAPAGVRSTYVGLTGTVRNVGKFAAPLAFGAATLALTVSHSFLALAGVGLMSIAVAKRVSRAHAEAVSSTPE